MSIDTSGNNHFKLLILNNRQHPLESHSKAQMLNATTFLKNNVTLLHNNYFKDAPCSHCQRSPRLTSSQSAAQLVWE